MNANHPSQGSITNPPDPFPAPDAFPAESLRAWWGDRMFYVVSAVLHLAVAAALSYSFTRATAPARTQAAAPAPNPPQAATPRVAIDVGPIKFCDLNIETLIGTTRTQPRP
jgi:hypothetical protein